VGGGGAPHRAVSAAAAAAAMGSIFNNNTLHLPQCAHDGIGAGIRDTPARDDQLLLEWLRVAAQAEQRISSPARVAVCAAPGSRRRWPRPLLR
jgi:hypothetical protein